MRDFKKEAEDQMAEAEVQAKKQVYGGCLVIAIIAIIIIVCVTKFCGSLPSHCDSYFQKYHEVPIECKEEVQKELEEKAKKKLEEEKQNNRNNANKQ